MADQHLTFRLIGDYTAGRLPREQIPALHAHVDACADCRALLTTTMTGMADHVTEKEAVDFVAGLLTAKQRDRVAGHSGQCPACAEMIADLEEFRGTIPQPRGMERSRLWLLPLAASVLVTAGLSGWFMTHHRDRIVAELRDSGVLLQLNDSGALVPDVKLSAEPAELVKEALRSGHLPDGPPAPAIEAQETLRSSSAAHVSPLHVLSPAHVWVLDDRPEFRWTDVEGVSSYEVLVVDEDLNEVMASGPVNASHWIPVTPLPRMKPLLWQVNAVRQGERLIAPVPPEPSPRFEIVPLEVAERIAVARRTNPKSHLLLAILYKKAGLRGEAEAEIAAIASLNPGSALVDSLRNSLAR